MPKLKFQIKPKIHMTKFFGIKAFGFNKAAEFCHLLFTLADFDIALGRL
jgi:hypothetical protein